MAYYTLNRVENFNPDDVQLMLKSTEKLLSSSQVWHIEPPPTNVEDAMSRFQYPIGVTMIVPGTLVERGGKVYQVTQRPFSDVLEGKITSEQEQMPELI